jgi:2',3'-cyclic-nucleotide 2'-phosphodiesterase (5'-nucleotidase family)
MSRASRLAAPLLLLCLAGCAANRAATPAPPPPAAAAPGERTVVLLAINDVYRIEGVDGGTIGSIARVRTLRQELEREHPDLLMLHAGDLLFPSFLSRTFNGQQMIDVLNDLDGDPNGFDARMFAVFGNHEFDKDKMKDAALLDSRVAESQFRWVNGNVVFAEGQDGRPLIAGDNLARTWLVESGGIKIGLFGLTVDVKRPAYAAQFQDPIATARELTAALRQQGAEVVVALTHLNARDDRRLLATLGAVGPDLVIGGHDHEHMACDVNGRKVFKADADARTATVVRLTLGADGKLGIDYHLKPLTSDVAEDCAVDGRAQRWLSLHEGLFCGQEAGKNGTPLVPDCLEKPVGSSRTTLEAEENKIRGSETNFGDWIADRMVEAFASCGAQAAFINSGSLRLNQDVPAGPLTRRTIEELFAYPSPLSLLRIKGSTLQQVAARAIAGWPGAGNWLQISGFSFLHDTANGKVSDVALVTAGGPRPVRPDEEILVVTNDYLFDPKGDRDGYTMLDPSLVVKDCAVNGKDLKTEIVIPALQAAAGGIDPRADGRIRQVPEKTTVDPCAGAP